MNLIDIYRLNFKIKEIRHDQTSIDKGWFCDWVRVGILPGSYDQELLKWAASHPGDRILYSEIEELLVARAAFIIEKITNYSLQESYFLALCYLLAFPNIEFISNKLLKLNILEPANIDKVYVRAPSILIEKIKQKLIFSEAISISESRVGITNKFNKHISKFNDSKST